MNLKKIVIINQDSGYLMVDIANNFKEKGYDCSLIAGRIVMRDTELNPEIKVHKIKRYDRKTNPRRIFSWLVGTFQIYCLLVFRFRKHHLFIVSNPPFAFLLPLFLRNEYSLMVFDLFPDALIEFKIVSRNSLLSKIWIWANRKVYKKASRIFTLTSGMRQAISYYINKEKIKITPLWTSTDFLKPIPKNLNTFIQQHNLQDKFIVLYSGNFGIAHYINLIIDLASKVSYERIIFVIIGGGPAEVAIKQKSHDLGLKNILILPWQDISVLPFSLSAADLSIVTLSENASKLGIPSKIFNYMAVGSPVLAITGSGSDLERLVIDYSIGRSFAPKQFEQIIQYIQDLSDSPELCESCRKNSFIASTYHTIKNVDLITQCYV